MAFKLTPERAVLYQPREAQRYHSAHRPSLLFIDVSSVRLGKLTGYAGTVSYMGSLGLPAPALFTVLAIIIEIGAGLLVLVGYKTRLVSLGLAIYVLVSAFIGHSHLDDLNQFQHFMKNLGIVGGSLAFVAFGGGAYALDDRKP